jgi:ribosomal protein S18 acetylase RimI-like enzyme
MWRLPSSVPPHVPPHQTVRPYTRSVRVQSLGLHTDLALHGWRGRVIDRHDHLVVTHPDNPGFRWGNLLVFDRPPEAGDLERWCALFDASIGTPPSFTHRSFLWDGLDGDEGDVQPFLDAGFVRETGVVMAAPRLAPPERPNREIRIRPLAGDDDWRAAHQGQAVAFERERDDDATRRFLERLMASYRRTVEAGHGVWWGAFLGDALVANLGIFRIDAFARFQAVVTERSVRRRGVASTLVHHAAEEARRAWGSDLVLLETDTTGPAFGLYERLGLATIESRVGVGQFPRPDAAPERTTDADAPWVEPAG